MTAKEFNARRNRVMRRYITAAREDNTALVNTNRAYRVAGLFPLR